MQMAMEEAYQIAAYTMISDHYRFEKEHNSTHQDHHDRDHHDDNSDSNLLMNCNKTSLSTSPQFDLRRISRRSPEHKLRKSLSLCSAKSEPSWSLPIIDERSPLPVEKDRGATSQRRHRRCKRRGSACSDSFYQASSSSFRYYSDTSSCSSSDEENNCDYHDADHHDISNRVSTVHIVHHDHHDATAQTTLYGKSVSDNDDDRPLQTAQCLRDAMLLQQKILALEDRWRSSSKSGYYTNCSDAGISSATTTITGYGDVESRWAA